MKNRHIFCAMMAAMMVLLTSCLQDPKEKIREQALNDGNYTTDIAWTVTKKDLGAIEEGQKVEVVFEYTNTGKKPLVIKNVTATCGCTVPEIPKEPVMPGKTGYIKAVFDSNGRQGENIKNITVEANTAPERSHDLEFTIKVNPKAEKAGA